jgi:hypothetical protein
MWQRQRNAIRMRLLTIVGVLLLLPTVAHAQTGSIAGVVKDASGAVIPGVTVEASSPALIEKVRTVVTDEKGEYKIIDLRPGTYAVTFTLTGFSTVKREGVDLTAGFTAPVDAEMKVGALEETVLVQTASPVVDVQNVRTQNTLTRAVLDAVPNAQTISSFSALTLGSVATGVTSGADVGGNQGEQGYVSIHHALLNDMKYMQDGMNTNNSMGTNGGIFKAGQNMNQLTLSEVQVVYNAGTAEFETAGANFNFITKDGGNIFSGAGRALFTNNSFQASNLGSDLTSRGVTSAQSVKLIYDDGVSVGGPIFKSRLWFFSAFRRWGAEEYQPNAFYNAIQGTGRYQPDTSRPAYYISETYEDDGHFTWQASPKDKFSLYVNYGNTCSCIQGVAANVAPEATLNNIIPNSLTQITWSRVQTSKLLFEAGYTYLWTSFRFPHTAGDVNYSVSANDIPTTELSTGFTYNARAATSLAYTDFPNSYTDPAGQQNVRASASYVTGSHAFKFGGTWARGVLEETGQVNTLPGFGPVSFQLLNGKPVSLTEYISPQFQSQGFRNAALYAQDQWTVATKVTLNLGVRGDFFNGFYPDQDIPASTFVPGFHIPGRSGVPSWKDISPRLGVAYRVTNDPSTVIKLSAGRYVAAQGAGLPQSINPASSIVTTAVRTWNDANGDFFPQASELGPISNTAFGTSVPNTIYAPDVITKNRPYTWQSSVAIERELLPRVGVSVAYFRVNNYNWTVTENTAVAPTDFTPFCVTAPSNPGLPGGGGNQICGLYDVNPSRFGKVSNLTTMASNFGSYTDTFNGVEVAVRARFGQGGLLQGGISLGRSETNTCFQNSRPDVLAAGTTATTPRTQAFCDVVAPWWAGNGQIKLSGNYPLPYGIQLAGVYQNLPGTPILANAVFTNAQVAPSLGRNLAACGTAVVCNSTVTVALIPNNTLFESRLNQLDFRVARVFQFRRVKATPSFDVYNLFNADTILARNNTLGGAWGTPLRWLDGRLAKLGIQVTF